MNSLIDHLIIKCMQIISYVDHFFYAFVEHYEIKQNLTDAMANLFQQDTKLLAIINNLFMAISSDITL